MSLRILHVLDHSLPLHSGYAFRTLSILKQQRTLGWETLHLTTPKQGEATAAVETVDDWSFHRTRVPQSGGLSAQMAATAARLDELVREWKPDIIHPHSPVLNALPALWVGRRRRLPVVYEMRASWEDAAVDHGTTHEGSLRYRLSRALESFALKRADQVTTICEGLRGDIVARGVDAADVTVIPNAVDVDGFHFGMPADPELRAQMGLKDKLVLGFVGSFYGYEGLANLVSAVARLQAKHPAIHLLLVGGGPEEQRLRQQVSELGLGDRVSFAGRVPHADVQRYYGLIDVLAYPRLPIRLTELVTPLKPLEAMAQGSLFVASDVGGHRELIRHGETGFLFRAGDVGALADCIDGVLGQPEKWDEIRQAGRRFVEGERNWANSVGRYREVYRRALALRGRVEPSLT